MTVDEAMKYAQGQLESAFEKWLSDECPSGDVEQVQRQWDESFAHEELVNELQPVMALTWEVSSLRSEIDSAREDLQSFVDDRNHWKTKAEAAEAVLQNLMSYLSVSNCRTEIDPENAELRIRDGIDMLMRPVLERADRAEKALKEAQGQDPVMYYVQTILDGEIVTGMGKYETHKTRKSAEERERIIRIKYSMDSVDVIPLYARPVPAVPAVPDEWLEFVKISATPPHAFTATRISWKKEGLIQAQYFSCRTCLCEWDEYQDEIHNDDCLYVKARALLQSAQQPTTGDA